jgi:HK97 family phage portal protein
MGIARALAGTFSRGHVLGEGDEGDLLLGGNRSAAGERVSESSAMKVAVIYSCVSLIASCVRAMPLRIRQDLGDGVLRDDRESRMWSLLSERPNEEMHAGTLWEWVTKCLLLRGNAFLYLQRDRAGRVTELWPLHPRRVYVRRDLITRRKVFEVMAPDNLERVEFFGTSQDILQIPGFDYNGLVGQSVIWHQRETVGRALREDRFASETLRNNARPAGVISVKGKLDPDRAKALGERWNAAHGGSKVGGTAVLEEDTKWEAVTMSAADLELVEQRGMSREDLALAFQIPGDFVYSGSKTNNLHYSSDASRDLRLVKYGVLPWGGRIQDALEICDLLPWRYGMSTGRRVPRFDPNGLLLADIKTRFEAHKMGIEGHFLAPDEAREEESLPPLGNAYSKPIPPVAKPSATAPGAGG